MKKQVLVAGGGIGGLAAALGASRAGWDVRLYERAAAFSEVGAGVQLGPNVVRRLQAWGQQQPLQAVAAFPARLQVRSAASGRELAVLPLGATAVERYGAAYACIHRADLHGLLLAALGKYTDTQLHLDTAIDRFTDDAKTIRRTGGLCLKRVPLERPLRLLGVRVGALARAGSPEALAPAGGAQRSAAAPESATASLF